MAVVLSGLALVPVMGLPKAGFSWQRYANAYVPTTLATNHASGSPGSFFTITGTNYPVNSTLAIHVNGAPLGSVLSDGNGNLLFVIDTTGANLGYYTVVVDPVNNVSTRFLLKLGDPVWPQDVGPPVLPLPPNISNQLIFLPGIFR